MGEQGAALQKYNQELVKCIEEIKVKRAEVYQDIEKEEQLKAGLEAEIAQLQGKLDMVSTSLKKKFALKHNYDKAIKESETAYMKILESSQVLLNMVRRESEILLSDDGS